MIFIHQTRSKSSSETNDSSFERANCRLPYVIFADSMLLSQQNILRVSYQTTSHFLSHPTKTPQKKAWRLVTSDRKKMHRTSTSVQYLSTVRGSQVAMIFTAVRSPSPGTRTDCMLYEASGKGIVSETSGISRRCGTAMTSVGWTLIAWLTTTPCRSHFRANRSCLSHSV